MIQIILSNDHKKKED